MKKAAGKVKLSASQGLSGMSVIGYNAGKSMASGLKSGIEVGGIAAKAAARKLRNEIDAILGGGSGNTVGGKTGTTGGKGTTGGGNTTTNQTYNVQGTVNVQSMSVRSDADVKRIAAEINQLQRRTLMGIGKI